MSEDNRSDDDAQWGWDDEQRDESPPSVSHDSDPEVEREITPTGSDATPAPEHTQPSRRRAAVLAGAITLGGLALVVGVLGAIGILPFGGSTSSAAQEAAVAQWQTNAADVAAGRERQRHSATEVADNQAIAALSAQERSSPPQASPSAPSESQSAPSKPGRIDTEEVRSIVQKAVAALETPKNTDERLADHGERITAILERMDAIARHMQALDKRLKSKSTNDTGDVVKSVTSKLEALNSEVATALANSRLALDGARQQGYVVGDTDWREVADADQSERLRDDARSRVAASGTDPRRPVRQEPQTLAHWRVTGMAANQAMIRSPSGQTYMVTPGDRVNGVGWVREIDPKKRVVVVGNSVIQGLGERDRS